MSTIRVAVEPRWFAVMYRCNRTVIRGSLGEEGCDEVELELEPDRHLDSRDLSHSPSDIERSSQRDLTAPVSWRWKGILSDNEKT